MGLGDTQVSSGNWSICSGYQDMKTIERDTELFWMALDRSQEILEVPDNLTSSSPSYDSDEAEFWQDNIIWGFGFVGHLEDMKL